jgi:chaperonin GroES
MHLWELLMDAGKEIATMGIRPLYDRILVKRIESQDVVKGGIIVPDTAKEKPTEGEVIAVGAGKIQKDGKRTPLDLKTGDRILFGKYAGTEIKFEDEELIIMREEDVLAVVAKPNKGKRKKKR